MKSKYSKIYFIFFVLLFIAFILEITQGAQKIHLSSILTRSDTFEKTILWNLRLPRAILVLLSGILLGAGGAVFQLFFRNPLAEPGILGITSGATLGAVFATAFVPAVTSISFLHNTFFSTILKYFSPVSLFAFIGAITAGIIVTALSFTQKKQNTSIVILLCGTALGTLYSSLSSLILLTKSQTLHSIYSWILGSFNGRGWNEVFFILLPAIVSLILIVFIAKPLDLLSGGETNAQSLGVQVSTLRIQVLIIGALCTSCVVCAGGTINFLGLIAPHIARKIVGPKSQKLIPFSMILSAIILLFADILCRIIVRPSELPTGIITSIIGVPFFITLCFEEK